MVGKLLGGGLVLLGTALLCRAETRTRRQQTERLAELSAALSEMAAGIRSLRRTLPCLLRQQTRRPLCGAYFGAVLEGLEVDSLCRTPGRMPSGSWSRRRRAACSGIRS